MKTRIFLVAVMILVAVGAAVPAQSQDRDSDEWHFTIAPFYLWASDLEGTLTARDREVPIVLPFDQAFDNLEMAFTVHFEAWKGRWGILTDFSYMDLSSDRTVGPLELTIGLENLIAEASAAYLFDDAAFFYLGARYYGMESAITGSRENEFEVDKSWVDPIMGFGWRPKLSKRWTFSATFDIGGFGFASDLTWKATAVLDWRVGKFIALGAGYRALDYDYEDEDDGFAYDVRQQGPAVFLRFFW